MIRKVYAGLSGNGDEPHDWSDRLVWSNLYKLAPADGGNPSETLCRLQFAPALRMFRVELESLRPRNVLILAGWDWASSFVQPTCECWSGEGDIEARARFHYEDGTTSRVVVTPHPQGRAESPLAREILQTFAEG